MSTSKIDAREIYFIYLLIYFKLACLTLPYLTFEVDATRGSVQRSGHQVGPLHVLIKPKAIRISQKL